MLRNGPWLRNPGDEGDWAWSAEHELPHKVPMKPSGILLQSRHWASMPRSSRSSPPLPSCGPPRPVETAVEKGRSRGPGAATSGTPKSTVRPPAVKMGGGLHSLLGWRVL